MLTNNLKRFDDDDVFMTSSFIFADVQLENLRTSTIFLRFCVESKIKKLITKMT